MMPPWPGTDGRLLRATLPASQMAASNPKCLVLLGIRLATPLRIRRYGVGLALCVPIAQTAFPESQVAGPDAVNRVRA